MQTRIISVLPGSKWLILLLALAVGLILPCGAAEAQEGGPVQALSGRAAPEAASFFLLPDLKQGQTLYLFAQTTAGNLDPSLLLADETLDRSEVRDQFWAEVQQALTAGRDPLKVVPEVANRFFLAWDDDSGPGYGAALEYTIPADGDYKLAVIASPTRPTSGQFRLLVGIDTPAVLDGSAAVTGDTIAVLDETETEANQAVQEVSGTLTATDPNTFFSLNPVKAGDTLTVFVEATSGDLAPVLLLNDFGDKPLATGNFSGAETTATLQYTFNADASNYRLRIRACCQEGDRTAGDYRLLVGLNVPQVLTGQAEARGQPVLALSKPVKAGVKLQQITGVDQKAENYGAVAALQLQWQDPALAFSPDSCQCNFKLFRGDSFFSFATTNNINWPEFTLFNQQGNRWTQNRLVLVQPDGNAIYFERFSTSFQAPDFNFKQFPFDKQDFYIRVDSIYPEEFFTFTDDPAFTGLGDQLGEEEWYITNVDTSVTGEMESTQATTSRYSFHFEARRHLNFYIFRIFLPLLIIIIISWVTFFLKDYGKRVDVASGNILLFIAFNFTISNDLPRLGYLTLMDQFLVSTFVVTGLVLVFNVYLKRLEVDGKRNFAQRIDKYMLWMYPLAYLVAFAIVTVSFT